MATVVAGKFEDLIAKGLEVVIGDDPHLELAARDVPLSEIETVAASHSPRSGWRTNSLPLAFLL